MAISLREKLIRALAFKKNPPEEEKPAPPPDPNPNHRPNFNYATAPRTVRCSAPWFDRTFLAARVHLRQHSRLPCLCGVAG